MESSVSSSDFYDFDTENLLDFDAAPILDFNGFQAKTIEIPPEASRGQTSSFVYGVPQGNAFTLPLPPALTTRTIANPMAAGLGANQNLLVELGKQLLEAARIGDENQIQDLLQRGAPMTADWLGTSPLHCAALNGHAHIAKILVNAGCSRDARTKVDKTALHLAATSGNSEITEMLLKAGADVNVVDALRMTPVMWAVESGDLDTVRLCLQYGADINVENKFTKTALEIASDKGFTEVYDMLLNADSYRMEQTEEQEMATRTITTELNDQQQYELTETITVPPSVTQEVTVASDDNLGMKLLSNYGIRMLPEDSTPMEIGSGSLSLTEAGRRVLSDTSPTKLKPLASKVKTIHIKPEPTPIATSNLNKAKIITLNNGTAVTGVKNVGPATRVIRLSSLQLNKLKSASPAGISSGAGGNKKLMLVSPTTASGVAKPNQTIKILSVGKASASATTATSLPKKTIMMKPAAIDSSEMTVHSTTDDNMGSSGGQSNEDAVWKKKYAEAEEAAASEKAEKERLRLEAKQREDEMMERLKNQEEELRKLREQLMSQAKK